MNKRRRLVAVAGLALVVAAAAIIAVIISRAPQGVHTGTTVNLVEPELVVIPSGSSAEEIARLLEKAGVVASARSFLAETRERGLETKLRPGTYEFARGEPVESVLNKLTKGLQSGPGKVTIPEGLSIDQVASRLEEQGVASGEEYERLARTPSAFTVPRVGGEKVAVSDLEGLLFPATYFLPTEKKEEALIEAQLEAFAEATADLPWERASDLKLTTYEVLIIASMIEKETALADERPLVAAVIYNRLRNDMRLDIDATVRFALKKWTGSLTRTDLTIDSPYNTRKYKGIPPGPIASPGVDAIKAALQPAQVDYLYYVLTPDGGQHFFTSSYEEFLQAAKNAPSQSED